MSQATIDIMNQHRKDQIEKSPSSEEFTINTGGLFFGIFDKSHIEGKRNDGNNKMKSTRGSIQVDTRPAGLEERVSIITRENGADSFTFFSFEIDDEGIPLIWLS